MNKIILTGRLTKDLETISRDVHQTAQFTYVTLPEILKLTA